MYFAKRLTHTRGLCFLYFIALSGAYVVVQLYGIAQMIVFQCFGAHNCCSENCTAYNRTVRTGTVQF